MATDRSQRDLLEQLQAELRHERAALADPSALLRGAEAELERLEARHQDALAEHARLEAKLRAREEQAVLARRELAQLEGQLRIAQEQERGAIHRLSDELDPSGSSGGCALLVALGAGGCGLTYWWMRRW